jgi:UDP-glucose 4-epimerase
LAQDGHEVRVLDNLTAGDPSRLLPEVKFERGDVADIPKLWTLLQNVACVYHLAARVSVPESIMYPRDYNHVNVGGTVSVMEAIRDAGVQRVVLASSGAVYGVQPGQPLREEMTPHPDSPYAVSKWAAETYVHTIGQLWGIETVSLRIFNAYGPGQQLPAVHAPVIPHYLRAALSGASLVVFGDGSQTRDFIYLDDVVDGLVAAATAPGLSRQVINLGSGVETSILDLIGAIEESTGRSLEPLINEAGSGGVPRMRADLERARRLLGFTPHYSLPAGLRRVLSHDARFALAT